MYAPKICIAYVCMYVGTDNNLLCMHHYVCMYACTDMYYVCTSMCFVHSNMYVYVYLCTNVLCMHLPICVMYVPVLCMYVPMCVIYAGSNMYYAYKEVCTSHFWHETTFLVWVLGKGYRRVPGREGGTVSRMQHYKEWGSRDDEIAERVGW